MAKVKTSLRKLKRRLDGVTMPLSRKRLDWGRNWLCMCGSGKKYKKCCLSQAQQQDSIDGNANEAPLPEGVQEIVQRHVMEKNSKLDEIKGVKHD